MERISYAVLRAKANDPRRVGVYPHSVRRTLWQSCVWGVLSACVAGCGDAGGGSGGGGNSTATGVGGSGPGKRTLAITITPAHMPSPSEKDSSDAVALALMAGCNGNFQPITWSAVEATPGTIDVADLGNGLDLQRNAGFDTLVFSVWMINTTTKETPPDLVTVAFDDPVMKARFHALVDALAPQLEGKVQYFAIGNEVDVYLASTDGWAAFQSFFEDGAAYVHEKLPGVKVGTTVTLGGALAHASEVNALTASADVMIFTDYALGPDFSVGGPEHGADDLDAMVMFAAGKPVVVQELGYPAAALLGGSEADQAAFVSNALKRWRVIGGDAMPFVSFFMMHDFSAATCDEYASYYGLGGDARFAAYLCSVGLRNNDGTPKLAWGALIDGAAGTGF